MGKVQETLDSLREGFFGFWVQKWRVSFIMIFLILIIGIGSVLSIKKESNPEIELGIITISTVYRGSGPIDIDQLVTEKIEDAIDDVDGISKISSSSVFGFSSIIIELESDYDINQAMADIESEVDTITLPEDTELPSISNISITNQPIFSIVLYGDEGLFTDAYIKEKFQLLKKNLEGKGDLDKIGLTVGHSNVNGLILAGGESDSIYEVKILVDRNKVVEYGIDLGYISNAIRNWNSNQPLGNHQVGELEYNFRIEGELEKIEELQYLPMKTNGKTIFLSDIAIIKRELVDESIKKTGGYDDYGYNYVKATVNKKSTTNILDASITIKQMLEEELSKPEYLGLKYNIVEDMGDYIKEDFSALASNGLMTIGFIFLLLLVFIGGKEAIIASLGIPLAFLITFFVLNRLGLSMNFMTNFSLIICFGIAVDTTLVIVEGAHEKIRQGFNPKNAILLAVREYKRPLIAGTATTLCAFLPMMLLPGIMGKFLAYIPITIFTTLLATLFISFTLNSAIYYKLSGKKKYYEPELSNKDLMIPENRDLLQHDIKGKEPLTEKDKNIDKIEYSISKRFRERVEILMGRFSKGYSEFLGRILHNSSSRFLAIMIPILVVICSFLFISPHLGFTLFPSSYIGMLNITITDNAGTPTEVMEKYANGIDEYLSSYPEIETWDYNVDGNKISGYIETVDDTAKTILYIEGELENQFEYLREQGLEVEVDIPANGPPSESPVGIILQAEDNAQYDLLFKVSQEFRDYLSTLEGTKNVSISSEESPGEFVFNLDKEKLLVLGLDPSNFYSKIYLNLNGLGAGTIKDQGYKLDVDVLYKDFEDGISPSDINNMSVATPKGNINFGDVSDYYIKSSTTKITRENLDIIIRVSSDYKDGYTPSEMQTELLKFAESYEYPEGISYRSGGETAENAELINAIVQAFAIALSLIFMILVLQFNSYLKPIMIMFTIFISLAGVNIGLLLLNQSYSIMFGVGFIALTGIVINDAIVFLDRADRNKKRGADIEHSLTEAGKARLQPILLTTLTTLLGMVTILSDAMWKPLAITIIFGLFVGSSMTLLSVPALYMDMKKIRHLIRRTIIPLFMFVGIVAISVLIIVGFGFILGKDITNPISLGILGLLSLVGVLVLGGLNVSKKGYTLTSRLPKMKYQTKDGTNISILKYIGRFFFILLIFLSPLIILFIIGGIVGKFASPEFTGTLSSYITIILYLVLITVELYHFRTNEDNQFWHDKIVGTIIIDEKENIDDSIEDLEQK